jgi:hypothetical protein
MALLDNRIWPLNSEDGDVLAQFIIAHPLLIGPDSPEHGLQVGAPWVVRTVSLLT